MKRIGFIKARFFFLLPIVFGISIVLFWFVKEKFGQPSENNFLSYFSFIREFQSSKTTSINSNPKRTSIEWPKDCDFYAHSSEENFPSPQVVCAEALESLKDRLPKECDFDSARSGKDGRIDYHLYADFLKDSPIRFFPLSEKKFLGELSCRSAAYNRYNVYFIYDESRLPAKTKILRFRAFRFEKGGGKISKRSFESDRLVRFYKPETKEFVAFIKYRGMGDCGEYFRYRLFESEEVVLQEIRAKLDCDGTDAYSAEEVPVEWTRYEIPFDFWKFLKIDIGERISRFANNL
ncbi:DUF1176 domain-containing protein [Leptospira yasudae]|uniref:DUF1176 domain-containing protein n=1 Tax=Leptospira yasudae TaxID=2202201 RepID=A0A6N4QVI5_9LEPT|nr:DUF1176 domain-containing protein [Leptospira yasudae]TGL76929.1 DUF1176 domain-containing protein [Leptospira yasudae]TGL79691.1 DUF1176 domain-containing protein [Leptospira yasudae]TGL82400.1 DUF1176 domain-containing protein [Leptospira yasudae]